MHLSDCYNRVLNRWLAIGMLVVIAADSSSAQEARPVSRATFEGWLQEWSNWGRWGDEDQLGTLNFITPETRKAAAAVVREGISVSMAHELLVEPAPDNGNPFEHTMVRGEADGDWAVDGISIVFHGYAHSHLDATCHRFHEGQMYNGYTWDDVTPEGCQKLAVTVAREGIFTRGILMDIPRLKSVDYLEPGTAIYAEDLEAWEAQAGVKVSEGDAVFLRTGRWARREKLGPWVIDQGAAGLHASAVRWLRDRGVAILGSDAGSDVFPSGVEGYTHPVHILVLYALGMPIFDNLDLEAVSREAAGLGRWDFLLTAAPLIISGGTGSPLNPIATF